MLKRIKYFIYTIFIFMIFSPNVSAGTLSIWASATNVTVGQKVTISVNAKNIAGTFKVTSSNNLVLSGGMSGEWLENDTYTYSFTAKSVGKATITVTALDEIGDFDTENGKYTGSTSKSVTLNVVAKSSSNESNSNSSGGTTADKKEYSSDNTLKSLSVEGFAISPKFDKDTTEYKLTVDESIEKIKINATTNHEKASVTGTGDVNLSSGENTLEIKVTAENGNEKKYKIIVTVEDQNPIKVKVDKEEFTIVKKNNNLIEKLEYYQETTIKIDNQDVIAYTNSKTKVTLVLLKDKDNKIDYYIYNEKTNEYRKYNYIKIQNITLQLLEPTDNLKNYKLYKININEKEVNIYKLKNTHKVGLIYGTNISTGNTDYYVYDELEETLGKYFDEELKIYEDKIDTIKNYAMIIIGVLSLIIIVIIVTSLIKGKSYRKRRKY